MKACTQPRRGRKCTQLMDALIALKAKFWKHELNTLHGLALRLTCQLAGNWELPCDNVHSIRKLTWLHGLSKCVQVVIPHSQELPEKYVRSRRAHDHQRRLSSNYDNRRECAQHTTNHRGDYYVTHEHGRVSRGMPWHGGHYLPNRGTKGVRNGGLGLTPLRRLIIIYKNCMTCAEGINCFRIPFAF